MSDVALSFPDSGGELAHMSAPVGAPARKQSGLRRVVRGVLRLFDSWSGHDDPQRAPEGDKTIDWARVWPFLAFHLTCFGVIWVGWSWTAVAMAVGLYVIRMFAITGFYHRYFSHRSFKTGRFMQFVFAVMGNSAMQRGPLWWAAHHRVHHRESDQKGDPHSPIQWGFLWSHIGWIASRENARTRLEHVPDLAKYRELRFLDRFDVLVPAALGVVIYGIGALLERFAPSLGTSGGQLLIWGCISTVALYHGTFTINSLSHLFGSRRFKTTDHSRNNVWLALITLGEGWHNNHHHYPHATRQGFYWWEIDVTYYGLRLLSWLRLVRDLKPVPARVLEDREALDVEVKAA
jgi:stearoyl-CoA desaturase (Delta-9 desaturase)